MQKTKSTSLNKVVIALLALAMAALPIIVSAASTGAGSGTGDTTPAVEAPAPVADPDPLPEPEPAPVEVAVPAPTPDPVPEATPEVVSEAVEWGACEMDGYQSEVGNEGNRRVCEGLQCGQLETMPERVECRMGLTEEEAKAEFQILFFPEYCMIEAEDEQAECIAVYKEFGECWSEFPRGEERMQCAKEVTGTENFEADVADCKDKEGDERVACKEELTESLEWLVLHNIYEVSAWAEKALADGNADEAAVIELVIAVEEAKVAIDENPSTEWVGTIENVQALWDDFVAEMK